MVTDDVDDVDGVENATDYGTNRIRGSKILAAPSQNPMTDEVVQYETDSTLPPP